MDKNTQTNKTYQQQQQQNVDHHLGEKLSLMGREKKSDLKKEKEKL